MVSYRLTFLLFAFLTIFSQARADEVVRYNQVNLSASAEREVSPDLMRITLYNEASDKDAARLAQTMTKSLNVAIEKARQVESITIRSGLRRSYPVYAQDVEGIANWQERAELHLESSDFASLVALTAELIGDLKIASHHFLISKPVMRKVENELIEEAIMAFGERAQIVTQSLGGSSYKIMQLNLGSQEGGRPLIMQRGTEMLMSSPAADSMSLQIETGTSEVVVHVDGIIEVE